MISAKIVKGSKLKGVARQSAEQHFLAAALRLVDQDQTRLAAIWKDYAASLPDPFHKWSRIHTQARHAAVVHAGSVPEAESLRHATFEIITENCALPAP